MNNRTFKPLPLGSLKPEGWLKQQLRIQADGLTGHLDEFWPSIRDAAWLGGPDDSWERVPYWLDGLVPLAYLLEDERLIKKVENCVNRILDLQHEDGWLGPRDEDGRSTRDPWPLFLILKVFAQYHEATGDDRIIDSMLKCCRAIDLYLDSNSLREWNAYRWPDLVWSLLWLHERTGEEFLMELGRRVSLMGYDWVKHFEELPFRDKVPVPGGNPLRGRWGYDNHVVNNAMAVKTAGMLQGLGLLDGAAGKTVKAIEELDRYHGQASGVFSGDESLAGKNPSQGTELCSVAEYIFSLGTAITASGKEGIAFSDRLEKITYNAFPATFGPDMWTHQYDQQANQVQCIRSEDRWFSSNNAEAHLFGLEPNYGCCTANMHQGWPKFASHLMMKTGTGLAVAVYAPSLAEAEIDGVPVIIEITTDYPFRDRITVTVRAEKPCEFPLELRIPSWAVQAEASFNGTDLPCKAGTYLTVENRWEGEQSVELTFPMKTEIERRFNNSAAILRGPLVFSFPVPERWERFNEDDPVRELPHGDFEIYPEGDWNWALDPESVSDDVEEHEIGECPFSPEGAPLRMKVKGRKLKEWKIEHGAAAPPPQSPVHSDEEDVELELIPYGCTNLRVSEFPVLE